MITYFSIFKKFDRDGSNSLEVDEFADMIINNYVVTKPVMLKKLEPSHPSQKFVDYITELLNTDLQEVYSLVTDSDSLSLEQFVTLSMSSQCNQMLNDLIRKVTGPLITAPRHQNHERTQRSC